MVTGSNLGLANRSASSPSWAGSLIQRESLIIKAWLGSQTLWAWSSLFLTVEAAGNRVNQRPPHREKLEKQIRESDEQRGRLGSTGLLCLDPEVMVVTAVFFFSVFFFISSVNYLNHPAKFLKSLNPHLALNQIERSFDTLHQKSSDKLSIHLSGSRAILNHRLRAPVFKEISKGHPGQRLQKKKKERNQLWFLAAKSSHQSNPNI